jgi:hypothetical protein
MRALSSLIGSFSFAAETRSYTKVTTRFAFAAPTIAALATLGL